MTEREREEDTEEEEEATEEGEDPPIQASLIQANQETETETETESERTRREAEVPMEVIVTILTLKRGLKEAIRRMRAETIQLIQRKASRRRTTRRVVQGPRVS